MGTDIEFDVDKASKNLCDLDLKFVYDNIEINVLWFRCMRTTGDWLIDRHMHSSFEFHFVASGSCLVTTDSTCFTIHQGEFYLTSPSVFHEQRNVGNEPFVEYSLNCDLSICSESSTEMSYLLHIFRNCQCLAYIDQFSCCNYFYLALQEAYFERPGFFSSIKNLIILILINAARCLSAHSVTTFNASAFEVPKKLGGINYRMSQIERFIFDNMSTPLTTSSIAAYMHLSEKQVCRIVQNSKGMSTKEFVNSTKLAKAKQLLKDSDIHIKKISDILGFSSEYYFSQFFSRMEGYPPSIYRNNLLKG